jgi:hypothetical protein
MDWLGYHSLLYVSSEPKVSNLNNDRSLTVVDTCCYLFVLCLVCECTTYGCEEWRNFFFFFIFFFFFFFFLFSSCTRRQMRPESDWMSCECRLPTNHTRLQASNRPVWRARPVRDARHARPFQGRFQVLRPHRGRLQRLRLYQINQRSDAESPLRFRPRRQRRRQPTTRPAMFVAMRSVANRAILANSKDVFVIQPASALAPTPRAVSRSAAIAPPIAAGRAIQALSFAAVSMALVLPPVSFATTANACRVRAASRCHVRQRAALAARV